MSANKAQKFKRKQLIVNKQFQIRMILKALLPLLIMMLLTGILVIWGLGAIESDFHFENTNELISLLSGRMGELFQSSAGLFGRMRAYAIIFLVAMLLVGSAYVVYVFLFVSHRIAGPIMRFEKTLDELLNGNLNMHINLREKDEFKETAEHFNEMLLALQSRVRRISENNHHSLQAIQELQKTASEQDKPGLQKLLELSQGIQASIDEFHTE